MPLVNSPIPSWIWSSAIPPKTDIQMALTRVGNNNTAVKNSLTVRPLDIRAINRPTKGDQDIHQAQ